MNSQICTITNYTITPAEDLYVSISDFKVKSNASGCIELQAYYKGSDVEYGIPFRVYFKNADETAPVVIDDTTTFATFTYVLLSNGDYIDKNSPINIALKIYDPESEIATNTLQIYLNDNEIPSRNIQTTWSANSSTLSCFIKISPPDGGFNLNPVNTLKLTIRNNSGLTKEITWSNLIYSAQTFIESLMNAPNPFKPNPREEATYFTFNSTKQINGGTIQIFTSTGRLVQTIRIINNNLVCSNSGYCSGWNGGPGYCQIPWDGADMSGNPLASGIYFYKVSLITAGGQEMKNKGKLAIINE